MGLSKKGNWIFDIGFLSGLIAMTISMLGAILLLYLEGLF